MTNATENWESTRRDLFPSLLRLRRVVISVPSRGILAQWGPLGTDAFRLAGLELRRLAESSPPVPRNELSRYPRVCTPRAPNRGYGMA